MTRTKKNEPKDLSDISTEALLQELERRQIDGSSTDMTDMELELEAEGVMRNARTMGEYLRRYSND
jgi:hypothetical protein